MHKKEMGIACGLAACALMGTATADTVQWQKSVTDGSYTNGANWSSGTFPGAATDTAVFYMDNGVPAAATEFRIGFDGAVSDANKLTVGSVKEDVPFVFAVTNGASWYKGPGAFHDSNYSFGFALCEGNSEARDNLSVWRGLGLNKSAIGFDSTTPCFLMSDALLSYTVNATTGSRIRFSQGTWNWYDPSGTASESPNNTMYVGWGQDGSGTVSEGLVFSVAADATLRGRNLNIARRTMEIEGGDHEVLGTLVVGTVRNNSATLRVKDGSLTTGALTLGGDVSTNRTADDNGVATLELSGTAAVTNTGLLSVASAVNAASEVLMRDSASLTSGDIRIGAGSSTRSGTLATVSVTNSASLRSTSTFWVGFTSSGVLALSDHALVRHARNSVFYVGMYSPGALHLSGDSSAVLSSPLTLSPQNANGTCEVIIGDRASLSFAAPEVGGSDNGYNVTLGAETEDYNRRVYFSLRDEATFTVMSGNNLVLKGTNTLFELAGGTATLRSVAAYASAKGDCRMRVSGGTHTITGNSYFGERAGDIIVYEQSGGRVQLGNTCEMRFAKSNTSTGRCILTGGVFLGKLGGGAAAGVRGGAGRAEFFSDGGTVKTLGAASTAYIGDFDEAILGPKGITFESTVAAGDPRADIKQAFTDKPGETGRFIKTGTGVARFFNTSTHGETALAGGTSYLMDSATSFGRSVVVTNGATLSAAGSFSAERLTLGAADGTRGMLVLPAGAVVTLTGNNAFSAPNGTIDYAPASTKGVYTIFRLTGTVDRAAFLRVALVQSSATLHYAFQFEEDGDDTLVQLVTYTNEDVPPTTWQGATSVFETPGNWAEGTAPGVTNAAVFPAGAAVKDVTITQQATVDSLVFAGGDYTIRGEGLLKTFGFTLSAGTAKVLSPLFAVGSLSLDVAAGTELTLEGALDGNFSASKTGKGQLTVASETSTAKSDWTLSGGITAFEHPEAIGTGDVTLGRATVRFTGEGETDAGITVDAGAGQAAVVDMATNVTFNGGFTTTSGGTLKTGAGTLDVHFPAGTFYLAKDDLGIEGNYSAGDMTSPDMTPVGADGEMTNCNGVAGFTVREGKVRLAGVGRDETMVKQQHVTLVGGKWRNDVADAVLEIANLTFDNKGTNYKRPEVGLCPSGTFVRPTIRVCDGAYFNVQGLLVGSFNVTSQDWWPTFEITNAAARVETMIYAGVDDKWYQTCHPTVRILSGAEVDVGVNGETRWGLQLNAQSDVVVDGGILRCHEACGGLHFTCCSCGRLLVKNGGVLKIPGIRSTGGSNAAYGNIFVTLDGSTLEMSTSRSDAIVDPERRHFVLGENGGTFCADEGVCYAFRVPITGSGTLTKTGVGEIVIGTGKELDPSDQKTVSDSGLVTGQWTGLTTVSEGKLTFEETTSVAGRSFVVAEGATLDLGGYAGALTSVSGAGTVTNATVSGLRIMAPRPDETPTPVELDVALSGRVTVDFGVPKTEEIVRPSAPVPVARLADGTVFDAANWKAKNCGAKTSATFACTDGIVYATFGNAPGFALIVR